jgi:PAS domain S-box-containing protein
MEAGIFLRYNPSAPFIVPYLVTKKPMILKNSKTLRRQAEAKLNDNTRLKTTPPMTETDTLRLLHELQVHQIELEMQNEQLIQSQAELKTALEQYTDLHNKLYDFAPVGYFTLKRDGTIQQANLAGASLLGVERGNLIRRRFWTFVSNEFRTRLKDCLEKVFASHNKETCEAAFVKDGQLFWAHLEAIENNDQGEECLIVMVDITQRKRIEEALKSSTQFSNSLISSMQDGISVLDENGVHLDVNSALCQMTGFSREELIGAGMPHPYWPPEAHNQIYAAFPKLLLGNIELTFMRRNGERFPVIVSPFAIKDSQANIVGYSATVKDITERKQMETALQQRKEELELNNFQQAERLHKLYEGDVERSEKRRLQLALDLHDIVLNQLAILRLSVDDSHVTQNFHQAYDQVTRRLREIVTDLRPPMLSYGLKPAIEGLADNMVDRNRDTLNVAIDLQIEGEARYTESIEQHLFRIVQEACENALRHSRATQVRVSAKLQAESVWLSVEDNGNGFKSGGRIELDDLLVNKHFGLVGMMERAMLIGAKVEINSFPNDGTRIAITWNNTPKES